MRIASLTRSLLAATFALVTALPSPLLLPQHDAQGHDAQGHDSHGHDSHSHAVSFEFAHGQLHAVLRHADSPRHHHAPATTVLDHAHDAGSHADHVLHAPAGDSFSTRTTRIAASPSLPVFVASGERAPSPLSRLRVVPAAPRLQSTLSARRSIVLIV